MKKIKTIESKYDFDIDFEMFNTSEIVKIYNFYGLVNNYHKTHNNPERLYNEYLEYKNTINSIMLEKKYDKSFEKHYGYTIYSIIKEVKERLNK